MFRGPNAESPGTIVAQELRGCDGRQGVQKSDVVVIEVDHLIKPSLEVGQVPKGRVAQRCVSGRLEGDPQHPRPEARGPAPVTAEGD